ncbi:glycosyltransferase family 39 protein [Solimonas soli]|uniref:glycosyltransferase family 39 protein n=1 Tax=Solimonas soli TaxID=413479 RepID=UPI0004BCBB8D|nr:glycosyltransferase family 39 protein [Solimonas soli]
MSAVPLPPLRQDAAGSAAPAAWRPRLRAAVIVFVVAVWLLPLGYRNLFETDEGRYAEIPREMTVSGDWITPRLNDLKYFEKPALQYWITAASFEAFGESAFTARLWNGIAGLLTVLAVWRTGRQLWGPRGGDCAGLAATGMAGLIAGSQALTLDMGVTLFLTLALCGLLLAFDARNDAATRRRLMLGVWAAMAGAVLSKGLIGLLIPGTVLVLYSLVQTQWRFWRELEWLRGGALFLLLAAPWFVLVSLRNPEFARFFFVHEHFERFLTTEHHREGPLWYYVPLLLGGLLPWVTMLPAAARLNWQHAPQHARLHAGRLLLIWSAFVFVFFSVSGSKLPLYILPLFPAAALLLGPHLERMAAPSLRRHAQLLAAFWLLIAVIAPLVLLRLHSARTPQALNAAFAPWAAGAAAAFVIIAFIAAREAAHGRSGRAVPLLAAAGLVTLQLLNTGFQAYAPVRSSRGIAAQVQPYLHPQTALFILQQYDQTLPFYLERPLTVVGWTGELALGRAQEPWKMIDDLQGFEQRWREAPDAIAFATPQLAARLQAEGLPMTIIATSVRDVAFRKP